MRKGHLKALLSLSIFVAGSTAFVTKRVVMPSRNNNFLHHSRQRSMFQVKSASVVDVDSLLPMDVVVFRCIDNGTIDTATAKHVGALQENGRIALLSLWTNEPAFASSLEFVVDEMDMEGYTFDQVQIESVIPQNSLSYGSRQVGGGKGPGNPHGEESELLYYIEEKELNDIALSVRPHLEILW